jgi:alkanesulfonate monooxygenase SsuD/methylene tetrahydromethanopterin reductase-like flavin-dependent oxidoreductase (luciferase family)
MLVSVFLPDRHDWPSVVRWAQAAEAAGFDRVLMSDHLSYGMPQLEAWTAMSALAAVTSRVELGFGVLSVTFRRPGLLARMVDSLDQISGGRLSVGLGSGIDPVEHEQYRLPFPSAGQRVALLDDCCSTLRQLCERPVRLTIGAGGDRALEVAARQADEWNCGGPFLDRAADRIARLHSLLQSPIARSISLPIVLGEVPDSDMARRHNLHLGLHGSVDQMVERCAELRRLGFDGIWLRVSDVACFERALELLPHLRRL